MELSEAEKIISKYDDSATKEDRVGKKIKYSYDGTKEHEEEWIILYDYGNSVEIVSTNTLGTLTLGGSESDDAITSYNDAIALINEYCETLITNSNKISVRSVGSNPENPLNESEQGYNETEYKFNGATISTGKLEDNNYIEDITIMNELEIVNTLDNKSYWIPSRTNHIRTDKSGFLGYYIRYVNENEINESCIFDIYGRGGTFGYSVTYPVRPIVKINY